MKSTGFLVLTATLLFSACRNPLQELLRSSRPSATGTITVTVSSREGARTVVPDYVSQVDEIEVNLASSDGYAPISRTATTPPWQVIFADIPAGGWAVEVVAKKGGVQIGSGSGEVATLAPGESVNIPVAVTFSPTGTTGEVSFAVSFPASTNIDYVVGILGPGEWSDPPIVETDGTRSATLSFTGVPAGIQHLALIFNRGGSAGPRAGYFLELVVVAAGLTSGSWVAADGSLVAERTFAETEFFDNTSQLGNLMINGILWRGFDPVNTDYTLGSTEASTVTFQASTMVAGQYLQYRWNGGDLTEIVPDTESSPLVLSDDPAVLLADNTLEVVVTAPDRETTTTYTVRLSKAYTVEYIAAGTTGGAPPVDTNLYEAGQTVTVLGNPGNLTYLPSYALAGWMAEDDLTFYAFGSSYTMPAGHAVFDSQWDRWTRLFGVSGASIVSNDIAVDSDGNSYVVGTTSVALDDQGLTGIQDAFVTKYDTAGKKQWTRLLGAAGEVTNGNGISVDSVSGDCYITGSVTGYGGGVLDGVSITGNTDAFVTRYTVDGAKLWTQLSGVVGHSTYGYGVSAGTTAGCAVTGYTDGNLDLQPLTGTRDTFVMRYDPGGGKMWTVLTGEVNSSVVGKAISLDGAGSCYVTGYAIGGLVDRPPIGLRDAFVVKYDMTGLELWTALSGYSGVYTDGSGIVVDPAGDCYVTGSTSGPLDEQPKTGTFDLFVKKYDYTGNGVWTRLCGGTSGSVTVGTGIRVDPGGVCYVAGHTTGGFDGLGAIGEEDTFVISYDLAGAKLWSRLAGVAGAVTEGVGIAVDPWMNTYVTGTTSGPLDGQPLTGTQDLFVTTRLNP